MAGNLPVRQPDGGSASQMSPRRSPGGLFTDLLGFDPFRGLLPMLANAPSTLGAEISRTEEGYMVEIPVPGFRPEQIEVTVQDDTVMVSGKSDRRSFTRSLVLPEEIDPDGISANVDHGLLCLQLRQRPEKQPRRITVQSGPSASTERPATGSPEQAPTANAGQRATASTASEN